MNYQTTAFLSGMVRPAWAKKIFNGPELVIPAGVLAPTAKAEFIEGGILVNGRWSFASGCNNANWLLGTVLMVDRNGETLFDSAGKAML